MKTGWLTNSLARGSIFHEHSHHSPILMTFPGAEILELSGTGIRPVHYRDTEHYQITRRFLNDPGRMLAALGLDGPEET